MDFHFNLPKDDQPELWNDKTTYRMLSTEIDRSEVDEGAVIPKGGPLKLDYVKKKSKPLKRVRVFLNAAADATTVQVSKGGLFRVNDVIGNGEKAAKITKIDTSNEKYDVFNLKLEVALTQGEVLHEAVSAEDASEKHLAEALNYAPTQALAKNSITPVGQAYEIEETKLIIPVTENDKKNLTGRFLFIKTE